MIKTPAEINARQRERRAENGNAYTRKYEKSIPGFLMRTYRNMKSRVTGIQKNKHHLYADIELIGKEDFYAWSKADADFLGLFAAWESSNYDRLLTPSIDRKQAPGDYLIGNMQWITFQENSRRGGYWRPSEHGMTQYGERL